MTLQGGVVKARNDRGQPICGAKTRSGAACQKSPMPNGRCRLHGGKSLKGAASPRFVTGRYSKYLPAGLDERYSTALSDPEILNLSEEIALVDARKAELLGKLEGDYRDAGKSKWFLLSEAFHAFERATRTGNVADAGKALDDIRELIRRGVNEHAVWDEIGDLIDRRTRLVAAERARLKEMQAFVNVEDAHNLVRAFVSVVNMYVTDPGILSTINAEFLRISTRDNQRILNSEVEADAE